MSEYLDAAQARIEGATISGFPEYEVQADGSVWSNRNWRGYGRRQITPVLGAGGYLKVRLCRPDGSRVNRAVHRLVAEAFLGSRPDGEQIRHLNGNQKDNRVENLTWGTAQENASDRGRHGTTARGVRNGFSKLTEEAVRRIRNRVNAGESYRSVATDFGVNPATIGGIVRRERWSHVA